MLRRWIVVLVVGAALLSGGASLAQPRGAEAGWHRALFTMTRGAQRLARTRVAERNIVVHDGKRFAVSVNPARGLLAVSHPGGQVGYLLGPQGRLAGHDAAALQSLLSRLGAAPSTGQISSTLIQSARQQARRVDAEKSMDGRIDQLLGQAARAGAAGQALWTGKDAALYFRPEAQVLVGSKGLSQQGFFLRQGPAGLELRDVTSRQQLRAFLLDAK